MPYFNRIEALRGTIASYEEAGYFEGDLEIEVCICDDGSIKEPASAIGKRSWLKIKKLPDKKAWKCACTPINASVAMSSGKYILLTSPEVSHVGSIIPKMLESLNDPKDIILACVKGLPGTRKEHRGWYTHPVHRPVKYWWCQLMTRDFFDKIGGFDERYRKGRGYEDDDFCERLTNAGARWIWDEECVAVHINVKVHKPKHNVAMNRSLFAKTHGKKNARGG
jgi:hypothetical protein